MNEHLVEKVELMNFDHHPGLSSFSIRLENFQECLPSLPESSLRRLCILFIFHLLTTWLNQQMLRVPGGSQSLVHSNPLPLGEAEE